MTATEKANMHRSCTMHPASSTAAVAACHSTGQPSSLKSAAGQDSLDVVADAMLKAT
jgi:hypothetical protein